MIDESLFTPYYEKIANKLNSIIPSEWYEIVLYAEELGDTRSAVFFFKRNSGSEFVHSGKIPDIYNVSRKVYFDLMKEVSIIVKDLNAEFLKQGLEKWNALTFFLTKEFKFKTEFQYEINKAVGSYERGILWAYDKIHITPQDDFGKKILEEYLAD